MQTVDDLKRGLDDVAECMRSLAADADAAEKRAQEAEGVRTGCCVDLGLAYNASTMEILEALRALKKRCERAERAAASLRAHVETTHAAACGPINWACKMALNGTLPDRAVAELASRYDAQKSELAGAHRELVSLRAQVESLMGGAESKGPPKFEPAQAYVSRDGGTLSIAPGFTTIRACRVCGVLVTGGPTACVSCAEKEQDPVASPSSPKTGRWKCTHCDRRLLRDAVLPDAFEVSNASGRWVWGVDFARWYHFCDDGRSGYSCDRIGDAPEATP